MRIATFNLENLDERPGRAPDLGTRAGILRPRLERLDADILCLQEVNAQRVGAKGTPRTLRALDRLLEGTALQGYHRASTMRRDRRGPLELQNIVILSRTPIAWHRQYWHDLVTPPDYRPATAVPADPAAAVGWDRPVLHAAVALPGGRALHVVGLHLRAPLAAPVAGQKADAATWRSVAGWAEGFFLAAIKRSGQALEARLAVEAVFDDDPDALVALCGDMNAESHEMPLRILRGAPEDTGNAALAGRVLIPLERTVPESRRFSVLHGGVPAMPDHVLASRALVRRFTHVEIHNETLEDETAPDAADGSPESHHAPVVAAFDLDRA